jgi:hypothetical protein
MALVEGRGSGLCFGQRSSRCSSMTLIWLGGTGVVTTETLRLFAVGLPVVLIGA